MSNDFFCPPIFLSDVDMCGLCVWSAALGLAITHVGSPGGCDGVMYLKSKTPSTMSETTFTHIKDDRAAMVDISEKGVIGRRAVATGRIDLRRETIAAIQAGNVEKGNVLATARIAAIMAVKETPSTIPMCHQIPITGIDVNFEVVGDAGSVDGANAADSAGGADCTGSVGCVDHADGANAITAVVEVRSVGRTGVEMEALSGVSVALLTIWDMVKSAEKDESGNYPDTAISEIRVLEKVKY